MNWKELLTKEIESTYAAAEGLLDLVDEEMLQWKPATGSNWMSTAQLLKHVTNACGESMRGFVTGDWGLPEDVDVNSLPPEEMLPPAEKLPAVESLEETRQLLENDKQLAFSLLAECTEDDLAMKTARAPWDSDELFLGHRLLQMIDHLKVHKAQLFYYLKLYGKPVHTGDLWGM